MKMPFILSLFSLIPGFANAAEDTLRGTVLVNGNQFELQIDNSMVIPIEPSGCAHVAVYYVLNDSVGKEVELFGRYVEEPGKQEFMAGYARAIESSAAQAMAHN